ncbi:P2X purinoceptor 7 isoform X2 [Betta splendens]|uniref:P2X purinoceptor 7 isoform X2 n=1 Tax=Betta splendens TaxID=158456 RepID=A0A6P7NGQ7_BETSP|nr:P2X purinoceptor 7 isoform X2 [Betta splendens]
MLGLCQYETNKLVRIQSVRLGSLKWSLNAAILLVICVLMLWNRKYQQFDLVVSSVTMKVKGVTQAHLPGVGDVVWDVADYSGPQQDKNSFFVVTNVIVTKNQKQEKCPEVPNKDKLCRTDQDCRKGAWNEQSHGIQTGSCVKFDVLRKTCEVSAWCPVETRKHPPRPAVLAAAENFTVLIKNNIRFPAFNFFRRNILPDMNSTYLRTCHRGSDSLCPIFRLGDVVREAGENFSDMAVEGGVMGVLISWDCDLDLLTHRCLPRYSFRRLDEKENNRTLYPGLNFRSDGAPGQRYAKYNVVNGAEERTLYKAFGIRFDVMVFGQAGKFSFIQLIIYIGSTLSYYAVTTVLIDWLIGTRCYSAEVGPNYWQRKVEAVQDGLQCVLCVSYVDESDVRLVKASHKKSLQLLKPISLLPRQDTGHLTAALSWLQPTVDRDTEPKAGPGPEAGRVTGSGPGPEVGPGPEASSGPEAGREAGSGPGPEAGPGPELLPSAPAWCRCGRCSPCVLPQEELCCRRSAGACLTSSAPFEQLVLRRSLLAAVLLYQDPLSSPAGPGQAAALRHCAYRQYVSWRVGLPPKDAHPVVPSCCVRRIRERYPSPDGQYSGFMPVRTVTMKACANEKA